MTKIDPYLHAVLLLHGAGKEITETHLNSVLQAAGISTDSAKIKVLTEAVKDVNFEELLKNAMAVAVPVAEVKKEEIKVEDTAKKEEQAAEGLASLFG